MYVEKSEVNFDKQKVGYSTVYIYMWVVYTYHHGKSHVVVVHILGLGVVHRYYIHLPT